MAVVRAGVGGKVYVPFPAEKMYFRSPDVMRVRTACRRSPHNFLRRGLQVRHIARFPEGEVLHRGVHVVVVSVVVLDPWVRSGRKQRVGEGGGCMLLGMKAGTCEHPEQNGCGQAHEMSKT